MAKKLGRPAGKPKVYVCGFWVEKPLKEKLQRIVRKSGSTISGFFSSAIENHQEVDTKKMTGKP